MNLHGVGEEAITTAFKLLGYARRKSVKKGFSDDPVVCRKRREFAEEAIHWSPERLHRQMFSDEVWAIGGAHTMEYITVKEDGSERIDPKTVTHKYSKLPAWMFFGTITIRGKGPCFFQEKGEGTINSTKYDRRVLSLIQDYFELHSDEHLIFMQDNAPSHSSHETTENLSRRHIPYIKHPPYSPDLNLIEHVWNWMKDWIQERYWQARYNAAKIPLPQLRRIILAAQDAVPVNYIEALYDSWWRRCQAVIDAKGGPTKY